MRIKLLIHVGGTYFSHVPGDVVDWPTPAARAYVKEGYAERVPEPPAVASAGAGSR